MKYLILSLYVAMNVFGQFEADLDDFNKMLENTPSLYQIPATNNTTMNSVNNEYYKKIKYDRLNQINNYNNNKINTDYAIKNSTNNLIDFVNYGINNKTRFASNAPINEGVMGKAAQNLPDNTINKMITQVLNNMKFDFNDLKTNTYINHNDGFTHTTGNSFTTKTIIAPENHSFQPYKEMTTHNKTILNTYTNSTNTYSQDYIKQRNDYWKNEDYLKPSNTFAPPTSTWGNNNPLFNNFNNLNPSNNFNNLNPSNNFNNLNPSNNFNNLNPSNNFNNLNSYNNFNNGFK